MIVLLGYKENFSMLEGNVEFALLRKIASRAYAMKTATVRLVWRIKSKTIKAIADVSRECVSTVISLNAFHRPQ